MAGRENGSPRMRTSEFASDGGNTATLQAPPPTLPLPAVAESIQENEHYVVSEVLFTLSVPIWGSVNWRAFLEVNTCSVLYLRAAVACANGTVFIADPITASGDPANVPTAPVATLDAFRSFVPLPDIAAANPIALSGDFVRLTDFAAPADAPPTEPLPGNFLFTSTSSQFAATNAYHHCEFMFDTQQSYGFDIASYWGGTAFPVPVDHRGFNDQVNARANGTPGFTGLASFEFGRASSGSTVGIAVDQKVAWHEFCHGLLYNHVHSPNFNFAHSAGDSLAAIWADPISVAPDRFLTFPWISLIARRHDRDLASGWGWGGTQDGGGYDSEQILSTTLFRIYRSCGGDDASQPIKSYASDYVRYLIMRAIGSLGPAPITPTPIPDVFATALMNADVGTASFRGIPGGAFHKIIRWSFQKQALYRTGGQPATSEGSDPLVDVYIDDGRNGSYEYAPYFWENQNVWNRLAADGGTTHETPIVGVANYVYVKVQNRGTTAAANVRVRGFHCKPSTGLVWPDDWTAMTTDHIDVPGTIAPAGSTIVGPFEWTPTTVGHECLLMDASADGDLSNADPVSGTPASAGPIPHWRLVPFDNNIAQRNVAPVPGGGGGLNLVKAFANRVFVVNNPYERPVRITLEAVLPTALMRKRFEMRFQTGAAFTLGPRASREVTLQLHQGVEFSASDIGAGEMIRISTRADGQIIGGMSYFVDPKLREVPNELPNDRDDTDDDGPAVEEAEELLKLLKLGSVGDVEHVRVRRVTLEIDVCERDNER
ncbi:MAG: hypothetical protein NVS4B5_01880 [Vulcanimicrobiaceae bacterium]